MQVTYDDWEVKRQKYCLDLYFRGDNLFATVTPKLNHLACKVGRYISKAGIA